MAHTLWFADEFMERVVGRGESSGIVLTGWKFTTLKRLLIAVCLPKEAILRLTDELSEALGPTTSRSHSIQVLLQVCAALRF